MSASTVIAPVAALSVVLVESLSRSTRVPFSTIFTVEFLPMLATLLTVWPSVEMRIVASESFTA